MLKQREKVSPLDRIKGFHNVQFEEERGYVHALVAPHCTTHYHKIILNSPFLDKHVWQGETISCICGANRRARVLVMILTKE
jgi:hypothetical protein